MSPFLYTATTVETSVWSFLQEVVQFALALASLAVVVSPFVWKWWQRGRKKRAAERAAREDARVEAMVAAVDERLVKPLREKVDAIHHTTTVNGGQNSPPTLRDEVCELRKQQETAIKAVGAIAVNQAALRGDLQLHVDDSRRYLEEVAVVFAQHGITLPGLDGGD